jgi:hypothetical protein
MISRDQIEKILHINGVSPASPDEKIRSVLLSARFREEEVDTALMVLREDVNTKKTRVDGLHKVFRTNEPLSSAEIYNLLGIEVDLKELPATTRVKTRELSSLEVLIIFVISSILATVAVLFYMYYHSIGLYHPTVM